jgi:hypothetical protein
MNHHEISISDESVCSHVQQDVEERLCGAGGGLARHQEPIPRRRRQKIDTRIKKFENK